MLYLYCVRALRAAATSLFFNEESKGGRDAPDFLVWLGLWCCNPANVAISDTKCRNASLLAVADSNARRRIIGRAVFVQWVPF